MYSRYPVSISVRIKNVNILRVLPKSTKKPSYRNYIKKKKKKKSHEKVPNTRKVKTFWNN